MDRYKKHLADHLRFIDRSCRAFDQGDKAEAQRIAVSARIIFHQTGSSTSLLTHLNATVISMLSTANPPVAPNGACNLASLVIRCSDEGVSYTSHAPLGNAQTKKNVPCAEWWDAEIICLSSNVRMTRRKLVTSVANQDGGAHVDASLNPEYASIRDGVDLAISYRPAGEASEEICLEDHGAATLRQIGYEILNSPDLLVLQN